MEVVKDHPQGVKQESESKPDPLAVKPAPIKYDPTKKYKWEHTDVFYMSGTDFGAIMNGLGTFLSIYGPPIKVAEKAYESCQNVLKNAVENGIAKILPESEATEE